MMQSEVSHRLARMGKRGYSGSNWWTDSTGGVAHWLAVVVIAGIVVVVGAAALIGPGKGAPSAALTPRPSSSVATSPMSSPTPEAMTLAMPATPSLLIVGDSYTQGFAAKPETTNGWAYRAAADLGWENRIDGVGGTGFTWAGGTNNNGEGTFATRIQRAADNGDAAPNLIVLQGGHNDWRATPQELTDSITSTVNLVRDLYEGAQVVIVGPVAGDGKLMRDTSAVMAQAATKAGVPYIAPLDSGWFDDSSFDRFIIEDGTHLNTEGHAVFAERFLSAYRALFQS